MQRYISAHIQDHPAVLYMNGPEGDQSVSGAQGETGFERVQDYGERIGKEVVDLLDATQPTGSDFDFVLKEVDLPERVISAAFKYSAGQEYKLTEEEIEAATRGLFPSRAPLGAVRIGDILLICIPGEPIAAVGLAIEGVARDLGFEYPAVVALTNDSIGYILTPEEYQQGGYESAVSFYGENLGPLLVGESAKLVESLAGKTATARAEK
jgi:hypothetical protein